MHRRDFVQRLPMITSGLVVGASTLATSACAGTRYIVPRSAPDRLLVDASVLDGEGVFVQGPSMERPIYVRRAGSGDVTAVLATCTHLGCQPEPVGERLVCPCHGSQFSLDGAVLEGPAERPLRGYDVTEEGDVLSIWLGGRGGS